MVKELTAEEFTERLLPIFQHVRDNFKHRKEFSVPGELQPKEFFERWQSYMRLGIARTWEIPGAVLGAVFIQCMFTGVSMAMIVFWDSAGKTKEALQLLSECEKKAKEFGCESLHVSALNNLESDKMKHLYRRKGFKESETYFTKNLGV